jgi:photosystem II stability/assembly factor-like uncharacterized protein
MVRLTTLGLLLRLLTPDAVHAAEDQPVPPSGGLWQGTSCPPAATNPSPTSTFYVTNTGGGGGGFGRGDIHHHLGSIDFWDRRTGWTSGYGGVFKSADGGLTWERVQPMGDWSIVRMTGPQEVWLVSRAYVQGKAVYSLLHTTDGGKNWEDAKQRLPGMTSCVQLFCRGNERWLMGGMADGANFASSDGGTSWRRIDFHGLLAGGLLVAIPADVPSDAGDQPNAGFVAYVFGHRSSPTNSPLVKSTDGGRTWKQVTLPPDFPRGAIPTAMHFATSCKGWLGFNSGRVLCTPDGGRAWNWRNLPTDQAVTAIWMDQTGHGFVGVQNGPVWNGGGRDPWVGAYRDAVFETHDDGQTWRPVLSGMRQVNQFCAVSSDQVWGAGLMPSNMSNDLIIIWQSSLRTAAAPLCRP